MKASGFAILTAAGIFCAVSAQGQYKSPRSYFPKNNQTLPGNGGGQAAGGGGNIANAPGKQQPAKPPQPKFKDLPVNSQFYFLSDTNRAFTWTKVSSTTATNVKNGIVQTISSEVPIQK